MVSQVEFFNVASDEEDEYDSYMVNTIAETDDEEEAHEVGEMDEELRCKH